MYKKIENSFLGFPSRRVVVDAMLRYGLRVDESARIWCAEIEVPPAKIARALGLDRRVVIETARQIIRDKELFMILSALRPTAFISGAARVLGFGVLEIEADPHEKGVILEVASRVSGAGINIRQIVADDPDIYPNPKLTVVLEKPVPGSVIEKLRKSRKIKRISIG